MIRLFINQIKQLFTYNNKSVNPPDPKAEENILHNNNPYRSPIFKQSLTDDLDSACAAITIYMREDGEFAITSEFSHDNEEVAEISGRVLHMMNSGLLADYFLQSLQMWGEETEQKKFIFKVIAKWKGLFDENQLVDSNLAIDPSDVFSLKSLNKDS